MASTCSAGRTESEKWNTTPKLSSSLSCCAAPPGVLGGVRPFLAATPTPSKGLRRGTCQRRLPPNNCRIWAAGRVTLDAILYSCQAFRRWSPAHFASQDMRLSKSGGKLTSTARALWAPKMCCRRAIAVTSSTPAGIASPTSVCCRANMPMEPGEATRIIALPKLASRSGRTQKPDLFTLSNCSNTHTRPQALRTTNIRSQGLESPPPGPCRGLDLLTVAKQKKYPDSGLILRILNYVGEVYQVPEHHLTTSNNHSWCT
mmetsp:Transcript_55623/g.180487  ORF Transcript_55623/g.180487 Transcript_55623/m.180487 type:complete len:259 (-) Transcript_55623:43-819(-)